MAALLHISKRYEHYGGYLKYWSVSSHMASLGEQSEGDMNNLLVTRAFLKSGVSTLQ